MKHLIFTATIILAMLFANFASAAQISQAYYRGDKDLIYPIVTTENKKVSKKINAEIFKEVDRYVKSMERQAKENGHKIAGLGINFETPCNEEGGILSVVLTEYIFIEMAAHPSTFKRTFNFNSDSGAKLSVDSLSEIARVENGESAYSPRNVSRKLRDYAEKNNLFLFDKNIELKKVPDDFYFDENLHVHFIFQQYEVAPYAVGIIDLDADAE